MDKIEQQRQVLQEYFDRRARMLMFSEEEFQSLCEFYMMWLDTFEEEHRAALAQDIFVKIIQPKLDKEILNGK